MSATTVKVLFVDDDATLLELLRELMVSYSEDTWSVFTATEPARALTIIQEQRIDLLVVDVHMPVVDGVQFLKLLHRRHPSLLKVVLTGDTTGAFRAACLGSGAELYLEKPRNRNDWQSIYATLNELVRFLPAEQGFRGVLRKVGLQDIIQIECLSRNSSILEVIAGQLHGFIYIKDGRIIHAEDGTQNGIKAFFRLFAIPGGEFNLKAFTPPPCESIEGFTWESLLMEAAQNRDETSNEPAPPDLAADLAAAKAEAPAVTPRPSESSVPVGVQTETLRPQVDEVLICSPRGDVLYEWQCLSSTMRVRLLHQLFQQAGQMTQGLPMGAFERFEASESAVRVVVQVQPAHTTYVHTSDVPALQAAYVGAA